MKKKNLLTMAGAALAAGLSLVSTPGTQQTIETIAQGGTQIAAQQQTRRGHVNQRSTSQVQKVNRGAIRTQNYLPNGGGAALC